MPELSLAAIAAQLFTGLVLGGILVLLAIGLSLIFGLMGVVNFAHGSLYMLGAYFGFFLWGFTKSYWAALLIAPLLVGLFGLLVERSMIRRLYGRGPDDPLLLTFGLSLALVEAAKLVWGKIGLTLDPPAQLAGAVDLGFMKFPAFRLFVIAITAVVLVGLWVFLEKTNVGLIVRAGARDPLMVRALASTSVASGCSCSGSVSRWPVSPVSSPGRSAGSTRRWASRSSSSASWWWWWVAWAAWSARWWRDSSSARW